MGHVYGGLVPTEMGWRIAAEKDDYGALKVAMSA